MLIVFLLFRSKFIKNLKCVKRKEVVSIKMVFSGEFVEIDKVFYGHE